MPRAIWPNELTQPTVLAPCPRVDARGVLGARGGPVPLGDWPGPLLRL